MKACSENAIDEICYEDGPAVCELGRAECVPKWTSQSKPLVFHRGKTRGTKPTVQTKSEIRPCRIELLPTEGNLHRAGMLCYFSRARYAWLKTTLYRLIPELKKLRLYLNHAMPQSLSCLWYSTKTHSICGSPLQRSEQLVCAPLWKPIKPKSLLGLNRRPTQYG